MSPRRKQEEKGTQENRVPDEDNYSKRSTWSAKSNAFERQDKCTGVSSKAVAGGLYEDSFRRLIEIQARLKRAEMLG